jgi:nucleotide-binding universal stress UspA family protein
MDKIIWAIDPAQIEIDLNKELVHRWIDWAKEKKLQLQTAHVLTDIRAGESVADQIEDAKIKSKEHLEDLGATNLPETKILLAKPGNRQSAVETLLSYAEEEKSSCILVCSHGRVGLKRLVLGSFAEKLLQQSQSPILFLNHLEKEAEDYPHFKRALFCTDFSEYSLKAFQDFLPFAMHVGSTIIIFHAVTLSAAELTSTYIAPVLLPSDYLSDQLHWAKEKAQKWAKLSEEQGVRAQILVQDKGLGSNIGETILQTASAEKAEFIVMSSLNGPTSAFVLGSYAYDVLHSNRSPVMIYGPKAVH